MQQTSTSVVEGAETLARIYIDTLAQSEGVTMKSMVNRSGSGADAVDDLLGTDEREDGSTPFLRADLTVAAVLTARAIAAEPGLAKRLRREAPIVAIQTHTADLTELIGQIVLDCALPVTSRRKVIVRDGSERAHSPEKGNQDVALAVSARFPIVGIAPDPKRHLPSSLMRMAEYHLSVPSLDEWTLRLTIEAVTGKQYSGLIDADLVRIMDISDLSLSLRRDLSPEECLERLARTVTTKASFVGAGPALDDLDGYGEAKAWGMELAADMADFRAGRIAWDDVDHKGLLLSGPPGTGKTTFAQALAKSAGVPLVATSVAQWNASTYLSGTLQSIASVFAEAKRVAPSILFIDELDGISNRQNIREYAEYWVQIVNTLLELLAGIGDRMGVVVVAATNHPEKIDPAILRAGRLDHHIRLQKPDLDALTRIFRYHLGQDALPGEDLMQLALAAFGGTGADVEAWVRRAKATARRERREMGTHDVLSQILAQAPAIPPELRHRVAIHEAGHVVFGRASGIADLVGVSILRDGGATEVTGLSAIGATEERLQAALGFLLAGRAAEELVLGSASVGSGGTHAQSDLAQATRLAVMAETHYGYGQALGLVHLAGEHLDNLHLHPELLQAVKERLDRGFNYSTETLANHINEVVAIGAALDEAGYLSKTDVERIVHAAKAEDPLAVTGSAKLAQVTK